jgi:hypothetical protein
MKPEIIVPVVLFVCVAWAIKAVVDARMRGKLLAVNRPDDLIRLMILSDERQRRSTSLRWGIVLTCLALGFALIQLLGWDEGSPGVAGVLLGATGIGNILAYVIAGKMESRLPSDR